MSEYVGEFICSSENNNIDNLYEIFLPELESGFNDRAKFNIIKKGDKLNIKIFAKDVVALKAVINSVLKVLTIYESTKEMLENESYPTDDFGVGANSSKSSSSKTNG